MQIYLQIFVNSLADYTDYTDYFYYSIDGEYNAGKRNETKKRTQECAQNAQGKTGDRRRATMDRG